MHTIAAFVMQRLDTGKWLVLILAGLTFLSWWPGVPDAAPGNKTEVMPIQKAAPAVVSIEQTGPEMELRRQLRMKNGVAELGDSAPNVRFSEAPTGRFGFIAPTSLAMMLVTQSPDLVLDRVPSAANAYEIHKLADGNGMLVGFVAPELLPQITPTERPRNLLISLHSNPSDKAPYIIAVPLTKLAADRMPTRLDPKKPDGAVMLHMDLRSTVNRQSTHGMP
jgi:hypothetical protein